MKGVKCKMCHPAIESAGFGPLRKNERSSPTENPPFPHSQQLRTRKPLVQWLALRRAADYSPARLIPSLGWSVIAVKPIGREGSAGWHRKRNSEESMSIIFWSHGRSSKRFGWCFCRNRYFLKIYLISFPAIWGLSQRGQLWPHPVQLGF